MFGFVEVRHGADDLFGAFFWSSERPFDIDFLFPSFHISSLGFAICVLAMERRISSFFLLIFVLYLFYIPVDEILEQSFDVFQVYDWSMVIIFVLSLNYFSDWGVKLLLTIGKACLQRHKPFTMRCAGTFWGNRTLGSIHVAVLQSRLIQGLGSILRNFKFTFVVHFNPF